MMCDYEAQLKTFSDSSTRPEAEAYLEQYWLNWEIYESQWRAVQRNVFDQMAKRLPDMMFLSGFNIFPLEGLNVFTSEEDFLSLQEFMRRCGDEYFAIIQNESVVYRIWYGKDDWRTHPPLRFKYPVGVSWDELMSGASVSMEVFDWAYKAYFVFCDSGNWGRYVENEYEHPIIQNAFLPLNIMGFKPAFRAAFEESFEAIIRTQNDAGRTQELKSLLPEFFRV
jgi:hypothetical protein